MSLAVKRCCVYVDGEVDEGFRVVKIGDVYVAEDEWGGRVVGCEVDVINFVAERRDPVDGFLREYPELEVFGREWVGQWLYVKERLVEIAKALRRHPWMAEVLKQRRVLNPFQLEVLEAMDGSEVCLGVNGAFWCANNGRVRGVKLELETARWEKQEDRIRPVYRPRGLLAYTEGAKEYVAVL